MVILFDARALQSGIRSGVPRVAEYVLASLAEHAGEHTLIAFTSGLRKPELALPANVVRVHLRIPNKLLHFSLLCFGWPKLDVVAERLTGKKIDYVFLPNTHFFASKAPFALLVHDLSFLVLPQFFSLKDRLIHALKQPRRLLQNASLLFAVSRSTALDIKLFAKREDAIVVDPNPNDRHPRAGGDPSSDVQMDSRLHGNDMLVLGTTEPRKNLETAIEGFLNWKKPNAQLLIAGTITNHGASLRKKYSHEPSVVWLGTVTDARRDELLAKSAALLYPSRYEGFGLPIREAMRAGLSVITSHVTSLPEVAPPNAILIDPHRAETITAALTLLPRSSAETPIETKNVQLPLGQLIVDALKNIHNRT